MRINVTIPYSSNLAIKGQWGILAKGWIQKEKLLLTLYVTITSFLKDLSHLRLVLVTPITQINYTSHFSIDLIHTRQEEKADLICNFLT